MADREPRTEDRAATGDVEASTESCSCTTDLDRDVEDYASMERRRDESKLLDGDDSVLDADLPDDVQEALGRFLGGATVRTLGEWVEEMRERTGSGPIAFEDLCHEEDRTGHWADMDDERYHFTCFFDGVVMASLADEPVEVGTESPDGTRIEATATGDGTVTVDPPGTLVSFGVRTSPGADPDGEPTHEDVYASMCPVVKAFPTQRAYERWDRTVDAATVAMPLTDATALAEALVA